MPEIKISALYALFWVRRYKNTEETLTKKRDQCPYFRKINRNVFTFMRQVVWSKQIAVEVVGSSPWDLILSDLK